MADAILIGTLTNLPTWEWGPAPAPQRLSATPTQSPGAALLDALLEHLRQRPDRWVLLALGTLAHHHVVARQALIRHLRRLATLPDLAANALALDAVRQLSGDDPLAALSIATAAVQPRDRSGAPTDVAGAALLACDQLYTLLLALCYKDYDKILPLLTRMTGASTTDASSPTTEPVASLMDLAEQHAAAVTTGAAVLRHDALPHPSHRTTDSRASRLGQATILANFAGGGAYTTHTTALTERLTILLGDPDDEIAGTATEALRDLPRHDILLAERLLTAACTGRALAVSPGVLIRATQRFAPDLPDTLLDIAGRFLALHSNLVADMTTSAPHEAGVLAKLIMSQCSRGPYGPRTVRALDLIDRFVLTRAIGMDGYLAAADR